jgi:hypothetical protein
MPAVVADDILSTPGRATKKVSAHELLPTLKHVMGPAAHADKSYARCRRHHDPVAKIALWRKRE